MFEKEEFSDWFKENTPKEGLSENTTFSKQFVIDAWNGGYLAGYNKANEWHKTSEKLPKDCSLVLAYGFDDTEPTLYYYVASDTWEWMPKRIAVYVNDQIRLWKEPVQFQILLKLKSCCRPRKEYCCLPY